MANLQASYMGIDLKNPIIAGASELTRNVASIKKLEEAGAAALVTKSLFEEQVQLERFKLEEEATMYSERHAQMSSLFPQMEHAGPQEHLMWVKKSKEAVSIPVIGSLNCVNHETWVEYATMMQDTGVDGLELNFYASPRDAEQSGASIEDEQVAVAEEVVKAVSIPVSVKLSLFYSNPLHVISRFDKAGVKGIVLFNRLFQPDFDIEKEQNTLPFNLSSHIDSRVPLRFSGMLYGNIQADVCSNTGIFEGSDVVKMLLAGAECVQVVSTLFVNKMTHLQKMLKDVESWMDGKGYGLLTDFRGNMSKKNGKDPWSYERSQYVKLLFEAENIIKTAPLV